MGLGVLTNLTSFQSQQAFNQTQSALAVSIQRLSSGLRINSGADDAAGLAMSSQLTSQINGFTQAARNVNDGISVVQTADGVLSSISSQLQELRSLAVQASSSTYSAADRSSLDQQAQDLVNSINTTARSAKFNGATLLDGTYFNRQVHVGASAKDNVALTLPDQTPYALGSYIITTGLVTGSPLDSSNSITVNNVTTIGASVADSSNAGLTDGSAYALAVAFNAQTNLTGVTATASTTLKGVSSPTASTSMSDGDIVINGTSIGSITGASSDYAQGVQVQTAINAVSATTGVTASVDSTSGLLTLTASDGRDIILTLSDSADTASGLTSGTGTTTTHGQIQLSSAQPFSVAVSGSTDVANLADANTSTLSALSQINLTSTTNASSAIGIIDSAISQVDTTRGTLGAYQNRFQSISSQLSQASGNASTARGRIRDTDFAAETANLASQQVQQSIDVSMITQANAIPAAIAALLKGYPMSDALSTYSPSTFKIGA